MQAVERHHLQIDPEEDRTQLQRPSSFFRGEWINLWPVWILGVIEVVVILWFVVGV
ncbi:MAG TPA: hypothetical protein VFX03_04650 [Thermomicrobiales bacterium]|nr:hypothetical protein [Thermomicrobiales bacterium]